MPGRWGGELELSRIARLAAGVTCLGAAAIHAAAATAHAHHPLVAAFFSLLAAFQAMLGIAALSTTPFPAVAAVAVNGAAVVVWLTSRTTGIPGIPGAEAAEAATLPDTVATLLELAAVTAAGIVRRLTGLPLATLVVPRVRTGVIVALTAAAVASAAGVTDLASADHHDTAVAAGEAGHPHESGDVTAVRDDHQHGPAETGTASHAGHTPAEGGLAAANAHAHGGAATGVGEGDDHSAHAPPQPTVGPAAPGPATAPRTPSTSGTPARLRYGPFVIPPAGVSEAAHFNLILASVAKPCDDCYLASMRPDLVYADGSRANYDTGPMLHHAVWYQTGTPDATCNTRTRGERFFASGNERTSIQLPDGFGVPVTNRPWDMVVEIMNHAPTGQTVFVQLDVIHRPIADPGTRPVRPVWLDIANCRNSQYAVPAGPHTARWRWNSTVTGRVVAAGGHVHDGGVRTTLTNATAGQSMCTSWAGYGRDPSYQGSVESMNTCVWDRLGTVRAGEALELESHYNSHEARADVMGIMIAYIHPTTDLTAGSDPPASDPPPGSGSPPPPRHDH